MTSVTFRVSESKVSSLTLPSAIKVAHRATFKHLVATVVLVFASVINLYAQQAQQPSADEMLNQIGMLKRLEAMQPDSVAPKYKLALASLNFAITL